MQPTSIENTTYSRPNLQLTILKFLGNIFLEHSKGRDYQMKRVWSYESGCVEEGRFYRFFEFSLNSEGKIFYELQIRDKDICTR